MNGFVLNQVANGWTVTVRPHPGEIGETYVFENVREMAEWLAKQTGDLSMRQVHKLDWN